MKIIQIDQGFGPSPYSISLGEKYTVDDIKYPQYMREKEVGRDEKPPWGTTWYTEGEEGYLEYYRSNWDTSG